MPRKIHISPHTNFLAHHARSLLQVGISSSSVEEGDARLSPILGGPRKFSSWGKSLLGSGAQDLGSQRIRSYTQVRSCSSSKAMDVGQTGIRTGEIRKKADGFVGRWLQKGTCYELTETCKLVLLRGDITKWHVDRLTDAIVNAANNRMLGGGGVDGAIHAKAGPELREACRQSPEVARGVRCPTGEARITRGFKLPVSRIIHTVGPIYGYNDRSAELLTNAYKNSCALAVQEGVRFIAFPAISCGVYGYPIKEAAGIALRAVKERSAGLQEVHFVLYDQLCHDTWLEEADRTLKKV